jgi:hypothetical protein
MITIADIFESNAAVRTELLAEAGQISEAESQHAAEGEGWTLAQVFEHLALVDEGMTRICTRLLRQAKADGLTGDGRPPSLRSLLERRGHYETAKLEAPDIVVPRRGLAIADSLARLQDSRRRMEELRELFDTLDTSVHKFPHPYLGELSAAEWLALAGNHEARHLRQIRRIRAAIQT